MAADKPLAPFSEARDDEAILNFIFSRSAPAISFAPPPAPSSTEPLASSEGDGDNPELVQHAVWARLEADAVAAAERGDLEDALARLDRVCADAPDRSSGFNNRAQVRRLAKQPVAASLADLDRAIQLGRAWLDARRAGPPPPQRLLTFTRNTLRQAHTQRAILRQ
jgi:hypothetical protein